MGKVTNPPEVRALLRVRDGDDCALCGRPIDFSLPPNTLWGPSIEHLKPKAAGGTNDLANLRLSHAFPCNHSKGARWNGVDYSAKPPKPAAARSRRSIRRSQRERDIAKAKTARGPWGGIILIQERGPWGGLLAPVTSSAQAARP